MAPLSSSALGGRCLFVEQPRFYLQQKGKEDEGPHPIAYMTASRVLCGGSLPYLLRIYNLRKAMNRDDF